MEDDVDFSTEMFSLGLFNIGPQTATLAQHEPSKCGDRLYTSKSDVLRRQILTFNDGPRTEIFILVVDPYNMQICIPMKQKSLVRHL